MELAFIKNRVFGQNYALILRLTTPTPKILSGWIFYHKAATYAT